ncbi:MULTISPECIES: hypothetical protein [Leptospira]|uniref:Uncharacterized protein n=3 Tax=Leptospira TaxID=171 RepID=A0A2N0A3D6_9LEPT|nr:MULTISPECIES: hypothetical protein [Leptospira]EIE01620.1 hypothetical protein LEP1GSC185_3048 [Leptospira licerasiae serovar Varillal str. VAR 010]EJZ43098.1 hypothetical protein LEP1GSC178_2666 [Leptospira licerasiae str. MMD4847]PJZ78817.1 hypothetical protein CH365_00880 [Leptospira neocaledonica]TGM86424.1 hypothetical protein EHR05_15860 [Leptospira licerasiae]TGM98806.1 hypothetical protein EHR06_12840 [Leptospira dzoumogneensis]
MHPNHFETVYIRKNIIEEELSKLLKEFSGLSYKSLSDYDKGVYDGYTQAVTEVLRKVQNKR